MSDHLHVRASGREAVFAAGVGEIAVGSTRGCAVRLAEQSVAATHLLLRFADGVWMVQTLDPESPVFRDGHRVETLAIDAAMRLRLGDPVSGALLELAPADSELRDST